MADGFHDLRRGFATMDEDMLTHRQLTATMQQCDTKTTDL